MSWGSWALSWFMLVCIVMLANVSLPNTTIHSPISANTRVLPPGTGSQALCGPPCPCLSEDLEPSSHWSSQGRGLLPSEWGPHQCTRR